MACRDACTVVTSSRFSRLVETDLQPSAHGETEAKPRPSRSGLFKVSHRCIEVLSVLAEHPCAMAPCHDMEKMLPHAKTATSRAQPRRELRKNVR